MKKFAVVLSGCGVYDGAEIYEATFCLLAIKKSGNEYEIFAPDIDQHHVINHLTGQEMPEKRNVLVESARIARGKIRSLADLKPENFDALLLPGGFGAAKNLSTYAFEGASFKINAVLEGIITKMHKLQKPIGAVCISPVIISKALSNIEVTIGADEGTSKVIEQLGNQHRKTSKGEIWIDKKNKIVTAPCFMLDTSIVEVANETEKLVQAMISLM